MKYIRMTAAPDPDASPAVFKLLAASSAVEEARLVEWDFTDGDGLTTLFAVHGDHEAFTAALADVPEVVDADVTPDDDRRFYFLSKIRPPVFERMFKTFAARGLLVITPVRYRDGEIHVRLVGKSEDVQAVLDDVPSSITVEVHEIGERGFEHESVAATLSDRQREAVRTAIELGYYEMPRQATYDDIAERLGCAPSTASEHLQKAEMKIVRATMTEAEFSGTGSLLP